jgi:hypothetical protein
MHDVLRTNDLILLSFARAVLDEAGIATFTADEHFAGVEGSLGIFPRRLQVSGEDIGRARMALFEAGLGPHLVVSNP